MAFAEWAERGYPGVARVGSRLDVRTHILNEQGIPIRVPTDVVSLSEASGRSSHRP